MSEIQKILDQAKRLFESSQFEKSAELFINVAQLYVKGGNLEHAKNRYNNAAFCFYKGGNIKKAIQAYNNALELTEKLGDLPGKVTQLTGIGKVLKESGNSNKAVSYYQEALNLAEKIKFPRGIADSLTELGTILFEKKKYDEALEKYLLALEFSNQIKDKTLEYNLALNVSKILNNENSQSLAKSLCKMATEYYNKNKKEYAIFLSKNSLSLFRDLNYTNATVLILNNLGDIYEKLGSKNDAIQMYGEALKICAQIGDSKMHKALSDTIKKLNSKI